MLLATIDSIRRRPQVLSARQINKRSFRLKKKRSGRMPTVDAPQRSLDTSNQPATRFSRLPTHLDETLYVNRIPKALPSHLIEAISKNGWDPTCPPPKKAGHYMDPRELLYRTLMVQIAGGVDAAGYDGERFVELLTTLAHGYMGRILFRDQGQMSNLTEDMTQEAIAKCCMIVTRFAAWEIDRKTGKKTGKLNNAFAYFTTVIRNRFYETLGSCLSGSEVYLEDLKTENQVIGDLI